MKIHLIYFRTYPDAPREPAPCLTCFMMSSPEGRTSLPLLSPGEAWVWGLLCADGVRRECLLCDEHAKMAPKIAAHQRRRLGGN
jgi:hypothetical protein